MRRVTFTALLGALVAALFAIAPSRAAEAKVPQPFVVLVGVSEYKDKAINSRPHAEDDVKALYDVLTDKQYLGVPADRVRLLLGSEDAKRGSKLATKKNILEAVKWVCAEATADDPVYFAFVGQGCSLGERGDRRCYFAVDSSLAGREKDAVAAVSIAEEFDKLKSTKLCAFVDVNFKGYTTKDPVPEAVFSSGALYKELLGDDGSEEHSAKPGRAVFLATLGLTQSLDLKDHGLFAQVILDALKGKADKEGYEPDGLVTVDELAAYLREEMPKRAREHGKTKEEKEQFHLALGASAHFPLTTNSAVTAKVAERQKKLAALATDKTITDEMLEEGRDLLTRMPKLEAQRKLRQSYQKLVDGDLAFDKFKKEREGILASRRLERTDAVDFAKKVMEVVRIVRVGYVKEVNKGELVGWAVRGMYRRLDEKIPSEVQDKLGKIKSMTDAELRDVLADAREALGSREDLEKGKDLDLALERMLTHLDPYTSYYDPETVQKMEQDIKGQFTGIGVVIRKDTSKDLLQVVTPIKGSPAYKAGIQAGDLITRIYREVDNEGKKLPEPDDISTKGMSTNDAVKKILGQPKTKVKVTVEREGVEKPLEFELTRSLIEVESVLGFKRKDDDSWDYFVDPDSKIAYIRLTQFQKYTARDLEKVLGDLKKTGLKGLVLDLRFNPGGLLPSAVQISDLFVDDGLIVSIRERGKREQGYGGVSDGSHLNFPMVCMVNGMSASASEIVSACLQDHKRALVVGERSYGKGSVQSIQPLDTVAAGDVKAEIKMTTASFWRPSGKNLNKSTTTGKDEDEWGVTPDKGYIVPLTRTERDQLADAQETAAHILPLSKRSAAPKVEFQDKQLDKALEYLRGQIKTAIREPAKKAG
jgi:carboxyl-terminal processing protease